MFCNCSEFSLIIQEAQTSPIGKLCYLVIAASPYRASCVLYLLRLTILGPEPRLPRLLIAGADLIRIVRLAVLSIIVSIPEAIAGVSGGVVLSAGRKKTARAHNNDKREHYENPFASSVEPGAGVVRLWRRFQKRRLPDQFGDR